MISATISFFAILTVITLLFLLYKSKKRKALLRKPVVSIKETEIGKLDIQPVVSIGLTEEKSGFKPDNELMGSVLEEGTGVIDLHEGDSVLKDHSEGSKVIDLPEVILDSDDYFGINEPLNLPEITSVSNEHVKGSEFVTLPEATPVSDDHVESFEIIPLPEVVPVSEIGKEENKSKSLFEQFRPYDPTFDLINYLYPTAELLDNYSGIQITAEELDKEKLALISILDIYNIGIDHIRATVGPTVTLYEIIPSPGVRVAKIKGLENDIAMNLAKRCRVTGHIPGTNAVGIEIPHENPDIVSIRSVLQTEKFVNTTMDLPVVLGKSMRNEVFIADLAKMPHLLIAGATGQGKSVALNSILISLLYKKHPSQLKLVLIDINELEFTIYNQITRHFLAQLPGESEAVITSQVKALQVLNSMCLEMDQRYNLLNDAKVSNLSDYHTKFCNRQLNPNSGHRYLPFIVILIDEFADLITPKDTAVELLISRIAQKGRAVGIHLIISTRRPAINIITGAMKANFPCRIALKMSSIIDSKTILEDGEAVHLNGNGDMLFSTGFEKIHLQGAFVSSSEVDRVTEFIGNQRGYVCSYQLPVYHSDEYGSMNFDLDDRDAMFEDAARLIVMHQQGSTSLIQRKMKLGYNRSGRIMDQLEASGIVGPFEGIKAREVLITDSYALEQFLEFLNKK